MRRTAARRPRYRATQKSSRCRQKPAVPTDVATWAVTVDRRPGQRTPNACCRGSSGMRGSSEGHARFSDDLEFQGHALVFDDRAQPVIVALEFPGKGDPRTEQPAYAVCGHGVQEGAVSRRVGAHEVDVTAEPILAEVEHDRGPAPEIAAAAAKHVRIGGPQRSDDRPMFREPEPFARLGAFGGGHRRTSRWPLPYRPASRLTSAFSSGVMASSSTWSQAAS